jgi:peptidoglycan hydrolase CwlO-like protein
MTTKIGKALAIFVALAGVTFFGFAAVSAVGGPNWRVMMQAKDLHDYSFDASDDKQPTYTVKKILGSATVGSPTKNAPQAIVAARNDLKAAQQKERDALESDLDTLQKNLTTVKKFIADDQKGIDQRLTQLKTELDALNKKIEEVSKTIQQTSTQVDATQREAGRRQEDVRLYEIQLEELQTDKFRAEQQIKILRDQLVRIRGGNDQLQRRNDELKQTTGLK